MAAANSRPEYTRTGAKNLFVWLKIFLHAPAGPCKDPYTRVIYTVRIVIVIVIVIGGLKSRGLAKHIKMALKIFLL
jgi:hypothetical protein